MGKLIFVVFLILVGDIIWSLVDDEYPWNTEAACWDKSGKLVHYWARFKPGVEESPYLPIGNGVYRIKDTGRILKGACTSRWGVDKPDKRLFTGEE